MLNRVILIGRLTRDPDMKYSGSGIAVTTFTLAVDRPFQNGNGEREADFIPVVTWRQLAENCANYLRKGRLCAVEGRIQVRSWDTDNGRRYATEVVADNVRFLEKAEGGGSSGAGSAGSGRGTGGYDPFADDGKPIDISDDDLPFN